MKKILLIIIISFTSTLYSFADDIYNYKRMHSSYVCSDDIISKGDPSSIYIKVTKGMHKIKTVNAGGVDVTIFEGNGNTLIFAKEINKYGWIAFKSSSNINMGNALRELVINIYNLE